MTANKDFKKLVRARMAKTGERPGGCKAAADVGESLVGNSLHDEDVGRYAAARAQLLADTPPTPDEYADIAEISEQRVLERTGLSWAQWLTELDAIGAKELSHRDIAAQVREHWPQIGHWWAQTVTVSYERIRGLREKGQLCTGDFAASRSKTFPCSVTALWPHLASEERRSEWMGEPTRVRTATEPKSMRLDWPDGTRVALYLWEKGPDKCSVSLQHEKLPSAERREAEKAAWGERLKALSALLAQSLA